MFTISVWGHGGIKFRSLWTAGHYQRRGGRGWHRHLRRWSTLPAVHRAGNTVERADGRRPHAVVAYGGSNTREVNPRERSVVGYCGEAQGGRGSRRVLCLLVAPAGHRGFDSAGSRRGWLPPGGGHVEPGGPVRRLHGDEAPEFSQARAGPCGTAGSVRGPRRAGRRTPRSQPLEGTACRGSDYPDVENARKRLFSNLAVLGYHRPCSASICRASMNVCARADWTACPTLWSSTAYATRWRTTPSLTNRKKGRLEIERKYEITRGPERQARRGDDGPRD